MTFNIRWHQITVRSSKADWRRVLYAYLHPKTMKVLYVGKADLHSVRQRMEGVHKENVWRFLEENGIDEYVLLVGDIIHSDSRRFTSEMLSDIESLLIFRLKPPANIQSKKSRICRPGMVVVCEGDWFQTRARFVDIN